MNYAVGRAGSEGPAPREVCSLRGPGLSGPAEGASLWKSREGGPLHQQHSPRAMPPTRPWLSFAGSVVCAGLSGALTRVSLRTLRQSALGHPARSDGSPHLVEDMGG